MEKRISYSDNTEYIGTLSKGMRNGKGILKNSNGIIIYEGEWKNDFYNGTGTLYHGDGTSYTGNFIKGNKEGQGKILFSNGKIKYEGEFSNGEKDGLGKEYYEDESFYYGNYSQGKKNGYGIFDCNKGKYVLPDKSVYEGDFKNNLISGKVNNV